MDIVIDTIVTNNPNALLRTMILIERPDAKVRLPVTCPTLMDLASPGTTLGMIDRYKSSIPIGIEFKPDFGPYHLMNKAIAGLEDVDPVWFVDPGYGPF